MLGASSQIQRAHVDETFADTARIIILAYLTFAAVNDVAAADLTVDVDGVESQKGSIVFELDDSPSNWDNKTKPVATNTVEASVPITAYTFKNLPPGKYALGVFHDENGNGKLDMNFFGIPKEAYGFSNNVTFRRKPTFEESLIVVGKDDVKIFIHLGRAL
jgi:uncharacterized protein (DUF2141 family)